MTHEHEDHEHLTIAEFFDEYGVLLFFGSFFLMTCFLPLLFLDVEHKMFLYVGFSATVAIALALLIIPGLISRNKRKGPH